MMRKLFISSTAIFWLAVAVFWIADLRFVGDTGERLSVAGERMWTLEQVSRHDRAADCWMAIDGAVFDVTAYLPQHPSNPALVLPWCGKDASTAYRTKTKDRPHSAYADRVLTTFRIGRLID